MTDRDAKSTGRVRRRRTLAALLTTAALIASACSGDDSSTDDTAPDDTALDDTALDDTALDDTALDDTATDTTAPDDTSPDDTPLDDTPDDLSPTAIYPTLGPPTGEPMKVALVNTEGTPGLDFPDVRIDIGATFDYLNEHGGFGNRPVELVNCTANGSPESSQACAQEVVGKDVDLVLLGLELFADFATYTAADVPVIGMLPILAPDYTADALFFTGGSATTMGSIAAAADQLGAKSVAIVSADNAGSNANEVSLTASLDVAGIEHTTVKGGDNETDAGYQGLIRQAASSNPDMLVSLYADAGCIGTIRGRAALGIDIPVITTSICAETAVIDEVGDDALGWIFAGISTDDPTPERLIMQTIMAPALDVPVAEVDPNALGLGALGLVMVMSLATYANAMVAEGGEMSGAALYDYFASTPNLAQWPGGALVDCGAAAAYPAVCSFTLPFAEYQEGGGVITVPGLEAVSAIDYLP